MNDPHVVALLYRIESIDWGAAQPLGQDDPRFRLYVRDRTVRFELRDRYATEEEAQKGIGDHIRIWEFDWQLRRRPGSFWLVFDRAEIVDRRPTRTYSRKIRDHILFNHPAWVPSLRRHSQASALMLAITKAALRLACSAVTSPCCPIVTRLDLPPYRVCTRYTLDPLGYTYTPKSEEFQHLFSPAARQHQQPDGCRRLARHLSLRPPTPWVIAGQKPGTHLANINDPWLIVRARSGLDGVRIHDLRHSWASRALALGESLSMIGKLLGHNRIDTTALRTSCPGHGAVLGDRGGRQQRRRHPADADGGGGMAKLNRSISRRTVEALKVEKDTVFWERDEPGFGIRFHASGAKVYVVQTRHKGKSVRVTVGRRRVISAGEARGRAARIVNRIKAGEEPVAEPLPVEFAGGPTVADLVGALHGAARGGALQGVHGRRRPATARQAHPARVRQAAACGGEARRGCGIPRPAWRGSPRSQPGGGADVAHVRDSRGLGEGPGRYEL